MDDKLELLLSGQQFKRFQEMMYWPVEESYQLSLLDIRVLIFLKEHRRNNTAKDIVESHFLTKSHVSKSIESLIEKGYLKRVTDQRDRRLIHLMVQESADPVLQMVAQRQKEMRTMLFQGITEDEIEAMGRVAQKVVQNMARALEEL